MQQNIGEHRRRVNRCTAIGTESKRVAVAQPALAGLWEQGHVLDRSPQPPVRFVDGAILSNELPSTRDRCHKLRTVHRRGLGWDLHRPGRHPTSAQPQEPFATPMPHEVDHRRVITRDSLAQGGRWRPPRRREEALHLLPPAIVEAALVHELIVPRRPRPNEASLVVKGVDGGVGARGGGPGPGTGRGGGSSVGVGPGMTSPKSRPSGMWSRPRWQESFPSVFPGPYQPGVSGWRGGRR